MFVGPENSFDAGGGALASGIVAGDFGQQVSGLYQGVLDRLANARHQLVREQFHRQQHRQRGDHHVANEVADEEVHDG
ncbi:hypothetical protein D9M68_970300 [compost metagenome]